MAFNQDVKAVIPRPGVVADFLPYLLLASKRRLINLVDLAGHGTGRLNTDELRTLRVTVPPLSDQHAIAQVLGNLDAKIELNRRMNETLEGMATALFRSWFVDFDPVRANAGSHSTGVRSRGAQLFPDSFEDSVLGRVPRGWRVRRVDEVATIVGGGTPSTSVERFWEGGRHHWATPKDLAGIEVPVLVDTSRRITDEGLTQTASGLLPVGTVLLSSRAPIGYLAICEVPSAINQGFIAMIPHEGVTNLFLLLWAKSAHEQILSRANGSTFLEISKSNFRPMLIAVPPESVLSAFERLIRPEYLRIVANTRETLTLRNLRDSLLPMLVSGDLRIG
jgi:type I restriction enzyme S subunit